MSDPETIDMLVDRVSVIKCHECHTEVDVQRALPFSVVKCPKCSADLPVPALLGNFVLFKTIGKGAMGAVYQGFDQTLKRHVAIKVILASLGEDRSFVDNFIQEAQALAALNHVNVVQIYSCGTEKGQPYIVMELVTGERLDDVMNEAGPVNEKRLLDIALDVANGLKAANDIGLIHGDIKPQNILLDGKGTGKVVDFGLARSAADEASTAEIWGTPYYIAPEKARRQKEDHRADIYCLGATLFHALAGRPPFEGETAKDVVVKRLHEKAPSLQTLRPELNDETDHLIARMLEADPFRRYPTYDSMLSDLHKAISAARKGPRTVEPGAGAKKSPIAKLLMGIILLAVIGAGVWFFVLKKDPAPEPEAVKGRTVMKLVKGKLIPVFVPYEVGEEGDDGGDATKDAGVESTPAARGWLKGYQEVVLTTADGRGADTYIHSQKRKFNFGQDATLKANHSPTPSQKTYLRFDCTALNLFKSRKPTLRLTLAEDFLIENEVKPILKLWGILDASGAKQWEEGTGGLHAGFTGPATWNNAPANSLNSSKDVLKRQSVLLAIIPISETLKAGDTLELTIEDAETKDPFMAFIQDDSDKLITFVLTMEEIKKSDDIIVASKEHPSMDPPELHIYTSP